MANSQAARISGLVLSVSERSGSKKQDDGFYRPWTMMSARVLVGGQDICDVGIPVNDGQPAIRTARGEEVDWFVSIRHGQFLNIDYVKAWSEVESLV